MESIEPPSSIGFKPIQSIDYNHEIISFTERMEVNPLMESIERMESME